MSKTWIRTTTVILAVLIACGACFALGVYYSQKFSKAPPKPAPPTGDLKQERTVANGEENEPYWYKIGKPEVLPVWLTVIVTFCVGLIALDTLGDIKKQTRIGLRSSLVARKSVEAYIATERPFVIIETRGEQGFEFWAVNYGKSPAQIVFSNPVPIMEIPLLAELPKTLNYGSGFDNPNLRQINVQWIAPGKAHALGSFDPELLKCVTATAAKELAESLRVVIVYSALKYRGIHSKQTYTSTYCYRKYPNGLVMWGANVWNEYT